MREIEKRGACLAGETTSEAEVEVGDNGVSVEVGAIEATGIEAILDLGWTKLEHSPTS